MRSLSKVLEGLMDIDTDQDIDVIDSIFKKYLNRRNEGKKVMNDLIKIVKAEPGTKEIKKIPKRGNCIIFFSNERRKRYEMSVAYADTAEINVVYLDDMDAIFLNDWDDWLDDVTDEDDRMIIFSTSLETTNNFFDAIDKYLDVE